MINVGELLEDLYRLGRIDGFAQHQFDCIEDDYDAEIWFEQISKIAKKYNIEIKEYNEDWKPWEKAIDLNNIVETKIKDEIYQLIK